MAIDLTDFFKTHEESLNIILDLIPVPVFAKDIQGNYLTCNQSFEKFTGISRQQMIGKNVYDLWEKQLAEIYFAKDKELFDHQGIQIYESEVVAPNGDKVVVQFHKATFQEKNGDVAGLFGVIFDRTTENKLAEELRHLAYFDALTGLLNRRAGLDEARRLLSECTRKKRSFSLAMIDIDCFKAINDRYGHNVGDQTLEAIKIVSQGVLREYDQLIRYGGDEFILCFPETSTKEAHLKSPIGDP